MKRTFPFHPPLFALYPPLALYAANVSLIELRDIVLPLVACVTASSVLWLLIRLILRDWARAAAATTAVVFVFFSFDLLSKVWSIFFLNTFIISPAPMWLWGFAAILFAGLLGWKSRFNVLLTTFLNFVGTLLVLLAAGSILKSHWDIGQETARRTVPISSSTSMPLGKPDVFYIVLDGYGRTDVLERDYDFSDSWFVETLEKSGFYVARNAHTNYCQTELSLASSLNMRPIEELVRPTDDMVRVRAVLDERIDDSRVAQVFKARGYRYIAVTTGFPALRFDSADMRIERDSGAVLFWNALIKKTPLPPSDDLQGSSFAQRRKYLLAGFEALKSLAGPSRTPRFVVIHILAPHPPFVFGANGEERATKGTFDFWDGSHFNEHVGTDEEYRDGYRGQAQFMAKSLIDALSAFSFDRQSAPIILIQGDHGPKANLHQDLLEKTDVDEVFPILAAYKVPPEVKAKLYPGISPINSFRIILSSLFGSELPLLPDRSFYSPWGQPLNFTDVTQKLAPRQPVKAGENPTPSNSSSSIPRN